MIEKKAKSKDLIGVWKCEKCGKLVKVNTNYGICLTSYPPKHAYDYECSECGYSGRIYADDVNYISEGFFNELKEKEACECGCNKSTVAVKGKPDPVLLTMDIDSLKSIVNGYLNAIDSIYSKMVVIIKERRDQGCSSPSDFPGLSTFNKQLKSTKEALVKVIEDNIRSDYGEGNKSHEGKILAGKCLEIEPAGEISLDPGTYSRKPLHNNISGIKIVHPIRNEMAIEELDAESGKDYGCKCGCDHKDTKKD